MDRPELELALEGGTSVNAFHWPAASVMYIDTWRPSTLVVMTDGRRARVAGTKCRRGSLLRASREHRCRKMKRRGIANE
jgi:hypothetical protein